MRVVNVMASSLDGRIGAHSHESDDERQQIGITSDVDQLFLKNQIKSSDAIVVGATSIRPNGACLDAEGVNGVPPDWYIFCRGGIEEDALFWRQDHINRTLVSGPDGVAMPSPTTIEELKFSSPFPVRELFTRLKEKGYKRVLLFGGGILNQACYESGLVDELWLTLSPLILGKKEAPFLVQPPLSKPCQFRLMGSHCEEDFVFLNYAVLK